MTMQTNISIVGAIFRYINWTNCKHFGFKSENSPNKWGRTRKVPSLYQLPTAACCRARRTRVPRPPSANPLLRRQRELPPRRESSPRPCPWPTTSAPRATSICSSPSPQLPSARIAGITKAERWPIWWRKTSGGCIGEIAWLPSWPR